MKLAVKTTLLLFVATTAFILIVSAYFYSLINQNFTAQAQTLLQQSTMLLQQRLDSLKNRLTSEMEQLANSLFTENEATLAAILSDPPDLNTEVVGFAERLRRRTTLDFLYVISSDDLIVSNSMQPAAFGKSDTRSDFPINETAFALDGSSRIELKKKVTFGKHVLFLKGGYFLKESLDPFSPVGVRYDFIDAAGGGSISRPDNSSELTETLELHDYQGKHIANMIVAVSKQQLIDQKKELVTKSMLFITGALLLCLPLGYLLSLSISRPIAHLRNAAQEMSAGKLDIRVEREGAGEIVELMDAFNRMAEQLEENQRRLLQTERIAAWQEIARHLAHEIKNPLTPIRTSIANLRLCMEKAPEKFTEIFLESSESIAEEVEKLRHLADEFARFARLPAPQLQTGNLNDTVQKSVFLYKGMTPEDVTVKFEAGSVPAARFDPEQISEVVHNLLQNSVDAIAGKGQIRIYTGTRNLQDQRWVHLTIEDNGMGMNEQIRQQVFTPYFTTKRKGTGLGLAIVHRIVSEHGGNILIESEPGKGTTFEVLIPAS